MPNRKKRARRRQGGASALLPALIVVFALVAAALAAMLVHSDPLAPDPAEERLPYQYTSPINFADDATPQPLEVGVTATPGTTATPAPTELPPLWGEVEDLVTPEPAAGEEPDEEDAAEGDVPAATEDPAAYAKRLAPTPLPGNYFLTVYDRALRTPDDRAMIAVTVDECDDPEKMAEIVQTAQRYGAALTLFPTGAALMDHPEIFRFCLQFGYELENHTYDPDKLDYTLGDGELALQIWRQGIAMSYALGRDYQQHFYRPENRRSAIDQRTHFFLRKLGMLGVASYTHSYLFHDVDYLSKTLKNGNIYKFDMSKESMEVFEGFLAEANRKGYKMVTMNDLFGLSGNTSGNSLTIGQQTLPGMNDYIPSYYNLKLNDRARAVYTLQERLIELGYLVEAPGDQMADGIYGSATSVAVSEFQAQVGLAATGDADVKTQEKLFAADAPAKSLSPTPAPAEE